MKSANNHRLEAITDSSMPGGGLWGVLAFWGLHGWVLAYSFVMLGAFFIQFVKGEFPCPLCMLQRYGMFLSTMGALFVVMQARSGTLTASRYAQGLGMGLIGALAGAMVSLRQIALHIMPGDPGYGLPILGLHLYTWALVTFAVVLTYSGVALIFAPKSARKTVLQTLLSPPANRSLSICWSIANPPSMLETAISRKLRLLMAS